ncbi:MAG TPA: metallophosphoesterase, partial [Planctomycetota bacterium]|nr:metallophosphoesterase [Planctomycetota bacterium]
MWLRRLAGASLAGVGAAGAYAGWSTRLEVTTHRVALGLDRERRPFRVVLITDLHLTGDRDDRRPFLDAARRATPDLILIAGDTIDRAASIDLISILGALEAPLGTWAVPGNWDRMATDLSTLRRHYERAGVRLLVNERVSAGPVQICGVDDLVEGAPEIGAVEDAARGGPTILLTHCPAFVDQVASASTDTHRGLLALAGHTHGGQIAPFGFAPFTPPGSGSYVAGWYRSSDI